MSFTELMPIITMSLSAVAVILLIVLLSRKPRGVRPHELKEILSNELDKELARTEDSISDDLKAMGEANINAVSALGQALQTAQSLSGEKLAAQTGIFERSVTEKLIHHSHMMEEQKKSLDERLDRFSESEKEQSEKQRTEMREQLSQIVAELKSFEKSSEEKQERLRVSVSEGMRDIRDENGKKLDEIRVTVDEKLQTTLEKRISESFKTVSEQLEQVYKGLGEMQNLASDVGGLKKVLSGVKTRGILGEIQLGAILEEILTHEQYDENVPTVPGSTERVEFAVKLPAKDGTVYLPIDSKFPGERYSQLLDAMEAGDKAQIEAAYKALETVMRQEAKDIRDKYVEVPYTTNFGIMFLPFEGLYAEAVNRGLVEKLQREYQISIAGPSTMAALLNSLQMGFRTLAIQKRSNEVWQVLGAVKTEFDKFEGVMVKMQTHLNQTSGDLEQLMGTRTRAINKKLSSVQQLTEEKTEELLKIPNNFSGEDEG
ncbi:MAG: DNA recombination protein RmuC [Eubacteriales bacterium]|nr:DNA recombination protein RmuC [Eubacteriales bacterium]